MLHVHSGPQANGTHQYRQIVGAPMNSIRPVSFRSTVPHGFSRSRRPAVTSALRRLAVDRQSCHNNIMWGMPRAG